MRLRIYSVLCLIYSFESLFWVVYHMLKVLCNRSYRVPRCHAAVTTLMRFRTLVIKNGGVTTVTGF